MVDEYVYIAFHTTTKISQSEVSINDREATVDLSCHERAHHHHSSSSGNL